MRTIGLNLTTQPNPRILTILLLLCKNPFYFYDLNTTSNENIVFGQKILTLFTSFKVSWIIIITIISLLGIILYICKSAFEKGKRKSPDHLTSKLKKMEQQNSIFPTTIFTESFYVIKKRMREREKERKEKKKKRIFNFEKQIIISYSLKFQKMAALAIKLF